MKNIFIKQTVDFPSGQRSGGITTDGANGSCLRGSEDLNFDRFDADCGETGPLGSSHGAGPNCAWSAPGSTDRHGLV